MSDIKEDKACLVCGNATWQKCAENYIRCTNCGTRREIIKLTPAVIDRQATHGEFEFFSSVSQNLKGILRSAEPDLTDAQVEALEMICHKMARILTGNPNHKDHWEDIAGYAARISEKL